jgi:hypothetical protein
MENLLKSPQNLETVPLFLLFIGLLVASCTGTNQLKKVDKPFQKEHFTVISKPDSIQWKQPDSFHIKGKLRLFLSDEGVSERATADFRANGKQTLLKLKNSLGIEGLIILMDSDSVLEYNRIEKTAVKMDRKTWQRLSGVGNLPVSLIYLIQPESFFSAPNQWEYSEKNIRISSEFGTVRGYIPINSTFISRIESSNSEYPFKSIEFADYTSFQNRFIPKRITIFDLMEPRKISLQMADLKLDSDTSTITYSLPSSIEIQR